MAGSYCSTDALSLTCQFRAVTNIGLLTGILHRQTSVVPVFLEWKWHGPVAVLGIESLVHILSLMNQNSCQILDLAKDATIENMLL